MNPPTKALDNVHGNDTITADFSYQMAERDWNSEFQELNAKEDSQEKFVNIRFGI